MKGSEFEQELENLLIANDIVYKREGVKIRYGSKSSKGKYDFALDGYTIDAIECKVVASLQRLCYPRPNKIYASIKTHQLKALRACHNGIILVRDDSSGKTYSITPKDLDNIIIEHGLVASLKNYITHLEVDMSTLVKSIKKEVKHDN